MIHIDLTILPESVKAVVKIGGSPVNETYYSRRIIKIVPSLSNNLVLVMLPDNATYLVTHDQNCASEDIYIIDTIDAVAPESLFDLASKLNAIIKS